MNRVLLILSSMIVMTVAFAGCHTPEDTEDPSDPINGDPDRQITAVEVREVPASATDGEAIVCWFVDGRGTVPHTGVHFDNESHPGEQVDFGAYGPEERFPANATEADPDGYELPRTFCTTIPVQNETVYFRAHAMITAPGFLSGEHSIAAGQG